MSVVDRVWRFLRADLNDAGRTIAEIALATSASSSEVQVIVDRDPDIAWVGKRNGVDIYMSAAHWDREGMC